MTSDEDSHNKPRTGLVLEGGGLRALYTAGVLEHFMDAGIRLPYVVGVSAGACIGVSYISGQRGRNRRVNIDFVRDPRYLGLWNLITTRSLFGMDFLFTTIPGELVPFDFDAFQSSPVEFECGCFDVDAGVTVYLGKEHVQPGLPSLRATSSLPFVSPIFRYAGFGLLDGGTAAPIPVGRSIERGNAKHVVVLTRPEGYRKKPEALTKLSRLFYPGRPALVRALLARHEVYNAALARLESMESDGTALVFRPRRQMKVGRTTRSQALLTGLYELGRDDARGREAEMRAFILDS